MRFIAKYGNYRFCVRPQETEAYASGAVRIVREAIIARFTIDAASPEERAYARQMFNFNGFYQEEDLVSIREPDYRIAVFDSRLAQAEFGWTDEERIEVERVLIREAELVPQDLLVVEEKPLTPPWPTYDGYGGTRVQFLKKIQDDGYDAAEILAYERENQNRPEVIATLEQALEAEPDTTPAEEELVG